MSRSRSPGSCHEIYPFLSTPLQLHSSDQSFFHIPACISCTNILFPAWYLTKTVHGKHSHLLPVPCAVLWLPHGSCAEEIIKAAEAAADVPEAAQSQHKCSPISLQISALFILIEAPGKQHFVPLSWCLESQGGRRGKVGCAEKILQFLNRDSGANIQLIFSLYNKLCCLFAFLLLSFTASSFDSSIHAEGSRQQDLSCKSGTEMGQALI